MLIKSILITTSLLFPGEYSPPPEIKSVQSTVEPYSIEMTQSQPEKGGKLFPQKRSVKRMGLPLPSPLPELPWIFVGIIVLFLFLTWVLLGWKKIPGDRVLVLERMGKPHPSRKMLETRERIPSHNENPSPIDFLKTINPVTPGFVKNDGLYVCYPWDNDVTIISIPFTITAFKGKEEAKLGTKDNIQINVAIDINVQVVDPWKFKYQTGAEPFKEIADLMDDPIRRVVRSLTYEHVENMGSIELLRRLGLIIVPEHFETTERNSEGKPARQRTVGEYVDSLKNVRTKFKPPQAQDSFSEDEVRIFSSEHDPNESFKTGAAKFQEIRTLLWEQMEFQEQQTIERHIQEQGNNAPKLEKQYNDKQAFGEQLAEEGERLMQTLMNSGLRLEPPYLQYRDIIPPDDYQKALSKPALEVQNRKAKVEEEKTNSEVAQQQKTTQERQNEVLIARHKGYKQAQKKSGISAELSEIKAPILQEMAKNNRIVIGSNNMGQFFSLIDEHNQGDQSQGGKKKSNSDQSSSDSDEDDNR